MPVNWISRRRGADPPKNESGTMVARCRATSSLVLCLCKKVGDPGDAVKQARQIAIVCTHAQAYAIHLHDILLYRRWKEYPLRLVPHRRIFLEGHRRGVCR